MDSLDWLRYVCKAVSTSYGAFMEKTYSTNFFFSLLSHFFPFLYPATISRLVKRSNDEDSEDYHIYKTSFLAAVIEVQDRTRICIDPVDMIEERACLFKWSKISFAYSFHRSIPPRRRRTPPFPGRNTASHGSELKQSNTPSKRMTSYSPSLTVASTPSATIR